MLDREKVIEIVKTALLKQLHKVKYVQNGYPIEAVPKATILELDGLIGPEIDRICESIPSVSGEEIEEIMFVLDEFLGDTDPYLSEDMTDEDIKSEEPIVCAHMKLCSIRERSAFKSLQSIPDSRIEEILDLVRSFRNAPYGDVANKLFKEIKAAIKELTKNK